MFAWIQSLHDKLHGLDAEFRAEMAALKARVDALEGKTAPAPAPEQPQPGQTPPAA